MLGLKLNRVSKRAPWLTYGEPFPPDYARVFRYTYDVSCSDNGGYHPHPCKHNGHSIVTSNLMTSQWGHVTKQMWKHDEKFELLIWLWILHHVNHVTQQTYCLKSFRWKICFTEVWRSSTRCCWLLAVLPSDTLYWLFVLEYIGPWFQIHFEKRTHTEHHRIPRYWPDTARIVQVKISLLLYTVADASWVQI